MVTVSVGNSLLMHQIYVHSEDLDGWLAQPNEPLLPVYRDCFAELEGLRVEAEDGRHELRIVLNSGKAPGYLETQAGRFGGRFVIGCNGAAWREVGGETRLFAPPCGDFAVLRALLGVAEDAEGVVELRLPTGRTEVAIEEGKRWDGRDLVLTFFSEPERVRQRWSFRGGMERRVLWDLLDGLIREHRLALAVLEPHGDGAVDVVSLAAGRPVGKWTLPLVAADLFPGSHLRLTHGGDAAGDVPALEAPGVLPLSAGNCAVTAAVAVARGGVVARRSAPEGGAVLECYAALAERGFYGPLSGPVAGILSRFI